MQPISDSTLVAMGRQHVAAHDHNACPTCCPDGTCPIQPRPVPPSAPVTKWGPTTVGEPTSPETSPWPELKPATPPSMGLVAAPAPAVDEAISPPTSGGWFDQIRNALALIGAGALLLQGLKLAG